MTTTFETAKIGDRVWSITSGWGEVRGVDFSEDYSICVYFAGVEFKTYTVEGFYDVDNLNQSLFWDEVVIDAPLKPRTDSALPAEEKQVSALRDQIAIAYMQAQVQAGALYSTWDDLSGDAYKMADAMLKERNDGWSEVVRDPYGEP